MSGSHTTSGHLVVPSPYDEVTHVSIIEQRLGSQAVRYLSLDLLLDLLLCQQLRVFSTNVFRFQNLNFSIMSRRIPLHHGYR
jgi:hypothetical protein